MTGKRNKKREYLREKIISLKQTLRTKISETYEGVSKSFWTDSIMKCMLTFGITQ
jgi:hypothetical protein